MTILTWKESELRRSVPGQTVHYPDDIIHPGNGRAAQSRLTPAVQVLLNDIFGAKDGDAAETTHWSREQHKFCGRLLMQPEADAAQPGDEVETDLQLLANALDMTVEHLRANIHRRWGRGTIRVEQSKVKWTKGSGKWVIEPDFKAQFPSAAGSAHGSSAVLPFDGLNDIDRCLNDSERGEILAHLRAILRDLAKPQSHHVLVSVLGARGGNVENIVRDNLKLFGTQEAEELIQHVQAAEITCLLEFCRNIRTITVAVLVEDNNDIRIKEELRGLLGGVPRANAETGAKIQLRLAVRKYGNGLVPTIRGAGVSILDAPFDGRVDTARRVYVGPREPGNSGYDLHIVGLSARGGRWIGCFCQTFSDRWREAQGQPDQDLTADFDRSQVLHILDSLLAARR